MHNREGNVYPWRNPHREVGQSPAVKFNGEPWIDNVTGTPKIWNNPLHHFHFDAWLQANYTNLSLTDKRVVFPGIELTWEQHYHAHKAGDDWLLQKFGRKSPNMGALWKSSVKVHHMEELAEVMVNAARLKGAVIDEVKIGTLKNLSQAALKTFIKIACDPN